MADVHYLDVVTTLDLDPKPRLLEIANDDTMEHFFGIIWREDGEVTYHTSKSNMHEIVVECQRFLHKYFDGDFS